MSDADARQAGDAELGPEVVNLARALRSELQTLNDGELRRQARLVAFDQHMAQMEASIRNEVERLRTTGSVVELLADLLRQSLGEVQNERRFEPIHDELARLRDDVAALPAPDDQRVLGAIGALTGRLDRLDQLDTQLQSLPQQIPQPDLAPLREQLDQLHVRLAAIPTRDLRPIQDRLDALSVAVAALPAPDDSELRAELHAIRTTIELLPAVDLTPVETRLTDLGQQLESLPTVDLAPVHSALIALRASVDLLPTVDLAPVQAQLVALERKLDALPAPDDAAVHEAISSVAERVADLRQTMDGLPAAAAVHGIGQEVARLSGLVGSIPVYDDHLVREVISKLGAELDGLSTAITARFDALAGAQATLTRDLGQVTAGLADLAERARPITALESGLHAVRDALARLEAATDANMAGGREAADAQALALARVTAATDGFASTVGTLRGAMADAARAAAEDAAASLDERVDARLRGAEERLNETVERGLRSLDPQPLHDRLREIEERIAALKLPDLGPVAAQLARLDATITSESRVRPAAASQVEAFASSLGESSADILAQLAALTERVDRTAVASEHAAHLLREVLESTSRPARKAAPKKAAKKATSKPATPRKAKSEPGES